MQKKEDEYYEIDLLHLLKVLWERVWLIILAAVIAGGAAFGYAFKFIEPQYQSSALFYVNNSSFSVGSTEFSISSSQISAAQSLVDTYLVILKSRTTLEEVIEKAGLSYGYEQLGKMIDASSVNNTEIFKVNVKSTDPREAANIANTICTVLPKSISNVVDGSDVRIVDYAVISSKRISPSYTKYAAIGAVIGVVLSALAIILSDMLDDMIHESTYLSQNYETPVLSVIPNLSDGHHSHKNQYAYYDAYGYEKKAGAADIESKNSGKKNRSENRSHTATAALCDNLSFTAAESYKLLRTNLMFTVPGATGRRIIGVTSAVRGEGKSTTAINLAYALAETGANVLLIDADMRLPRIAQSLNVSNEQGLSNVLAGLCEVKDAVRPTKQLKNLFVMPAGAIPPNPSELLSSAGMKSLLDSLVEAVEYVVIDLPPVNIVSDALVISNIVDGMLITVRQNYSDKKSLEACVRQLKLVNAKIAGFVFNDASEEGTHYAMYKGHAKAYKKYYKKYGKNYGKGYGYGYGYEKKEKPEA